MAVAAQQFGQANHDALALCRVQLAPTAVVKRLARLADGKLDTIRITGGDLRDGFVIYRHFVGLSSSSQSKEIFLIIKSLRGN